MSSRPTRSSFQATSERWIGTFGILLFALAIAFLGVRAIRTGQFDLDSGPVAWSARPIKFTLLLLLHFGFSAGCLWLTRDLLKRPAQDPDDWRWGDVAPPASPDLSKPLRLPVSRRTAWIGIITVLIATVMVFVGTQLLMTLETWRSGSPSMRTIGWMLFAAWMPFLFLALFNCVRLLRWRGPALELGAAGIQDLRSGRPPAPWRDIERVRIEPEGRCSFEVRFKSLADARRHLGLARLPFALVNRFNGSGHWIIRLSDLDVDRAQLLAVAEAHLHQSRRMKP